jgi:hypothetical protein
MFLAIFQHQTEAKSENSLVAALTLDFQFKACKVLFNSQFPRNISIRIIFDIKRWYFELEFMKSIVIVAYLTSLMAIPAMVIMLYRTASVVVIKF